MDSSRDNLYCQYKEDLCLIPMTYHAGSGLFFGYPSEPKTSAEAIKCAIEALNKDRTVDVGLIDWKDLPVEGNIIFCEICEAIRKSSCVVLNVTNVNFNVLFEYGYAIGAGKAIWPLVEEGVVKGSRVYASIDALTTIGYSGFTNSKSIYTRVLKKKPWTRPSKFDLPEALGKDATRETVNVMYLHSMYDNEPSLRISEVLEGTHVGVIVDDPRESFHPLSWYIGNLGKCYAVIVHLGSERMAGYELHSVKCALVAGISLALGRRLLILGEDISLKPIDYRDILQSYKSTTQAEEITRRFLSRVQSFIHDSRERAKSYIMPPPPKLDLKDNMLLGIDLGDYIAENEEQALVDYFVETPQYLMALEPGFRVFIGRKGSGKTANFYMVMDNASRDKRNLVCTVKPKEWQLNELLQFIKNELTIAKRGYLLQSLWKYMVYSEVIKTCYSKIREKPEYSTFSDCENNIKKYVEDRESIFDASFTSRLVDTVKKVVNGFSSNGSGGVAVSEILHEKDIIQMHGMLLDYLAENEGACIIVIDSLDANWYLGEDYRIMADILLSLIDAARDMWRVCKRDLDKIGEYKNIAVLIFLRNDVFKVVLGEAKEPDKMQYELILWDKFDTLFEIVKMRILASLAKYNIDFLNWSDILEPGFNFENMKAFAKSSLVWRPRDIIYLFERAFYYSRSRNAKYLGKQDFDEAMTEYSEYVFRSLIAESQPYIPKMENLILEFAEDRATLSLEDIRSKFKSAGITRTNVQKTIDFLIESNFLGYEIKKGDVRFPVTPTDSAIVAKDIRDHIKRNKKTIKFRVHNAFHKALYITG